MTESFLSYLLAEVFALSGAQKVARPKRFLGALRDYSSLRKLPVPVAIVIAVCLPIVELLTAGLLILGSTAAAGAVMSMAMLVPFYLLIARDRRPAFSNCGCGGPSEVAAPKSSYLARNLVLLTTGVALLLLMHGGQRTSPAWPEILALVLMGAPFALLILDIPLVLHLLTVDRTQMPGKLSSTRSSLERRGK